MIRLPSGPRKFLLTDDEAAQRNRERRPGKCEPVAIVMVEEKGGTYTTLKALSVRTDGPVTLHYEQHGRIANRYRVAYVTTGEVVLDEDCAPERAVQDPSTPPPPPAVAPTAPPKKPKPAAEVSAKVKKTEEVTA